MKLSIIILGFISILIFSVLGCKKQKLTGCYKGRLEIKGLCLNYTIKVLQGDIDPNLIEANWTNPNTGITYHNVFALARLCDLPADIKEGDEFYFKIDDSPPLCAVCQGYYPTPSKQLAIDASKNPCN